MNNALLFCSLLLSTTTIHSMHQLSLQTAFVYNIAPRLDRDDRTALKLTNNFLCYIIIPQHILNEQYRFACATKHTEQINELRKKGALTPEEETYKLFLSHKKNLIISIVLRRGKPEIIRDIFFYGIKQNNVQFMQWLLNVKKPHYESQLISDSFKYADSLHHTEIAQLFKNYRHEGTRKYWDVKNIETKEPLVTLDDSPEISKNLHKSCIIS
jgi:hypothetical protein